VFYGGTSPDAIPDFTVTGEATFDNLGYAVSTAGDVDGDGAAEIIVAAPFADAGRAYLSKPTIGRAKPVAER
jgi:FG-GAP repeat